MLYDPFFVPQERWQEWLNGDVAYIISDEERRAFELLTTDQERRQFAEQFWLRRDPTPGAVENEYKEEHYRRIAYANEHFASSIPGWKTERGRVYITLGPPDEIDANRRPFPVEDWRYRYIEGFGYNVNIAFADPSSTGEYRMAADQPDRDRLENPGFPALGPPASATREVPMIRFKDLEDLA